MSNSAIRVMWTVIGLVLFVLGAAGLVAGLGWLPGVDSSTPLLWSGMLNLWRDISPWGLSLAIVLGLILVLLGLRLLSQQLRPPRGPAIGDLDLRAMAGDRIDRAPVNGVTLVHPARLADGLERDLARSPLVRRVSVTLTGAASSPDLWIRLWVTPRAGLSSVRDQVGAAVDRFRTTSGLHPARLDVTTRIDRSGAARVR
jgi:hypothetical protein